MTEIPVEVHRSRVSEAERKVYTLQERVRAGDITETSLTELGDAYDEYVQIRSENVALQPSRLSKFRSKRA